MTWMEFFKRQIPCIIHALLNISLFIERNFEPWCVGGGGGGYFNFISNLVLKLYMNEILQTPYFIFIENFLEPWEGGWFVVFFYFNFKEFSSSKQLFKEIFLMLIVTCHYCIMVFLFIFQRNSWWAWIILWLSEWTLC